MVSMTRTPNSDIQCESATIGGIRHVLLFTGAGGVTILKHIHAQSKAPIDIDDVKGATRQISKKTIAERLGVSCNAKTIHVPRTEL